MVQVQSLGGQYGHVQSKTNTMPDHHLPKERRLHGKLVERRQIGTAALSNLESHPEIPSETYMPGLFGTIEQVSEVLDGRAILAEC